MPIKPRQKVRMWAIVDPITLDAIMVCRTRSLAREFAKGTGAKIRSVVW